MRAKPREGVRRAIDFVALGPSCERGGLQMGVQPAMSGASREGLKRTPANQSRANEHGYNGISRTVTANVGDLSEAHS